jgi:hypothetical protein
MDKFYVVSDTWMQIDCSPFDTREEAEAAAQEANRGARVPCYSVKTQEQMDAYEAIED